MQEDNHSSTPSVHGISYTTHISSTQYFITPNPPKTSNPKDPNSVNYANRGTNNTTQHATTVKTGMYTCVTHTETNTHKVNNFFNNLIHPPHTSKFYFLKSRSSPSCQIFNQAWGHIKQQFPPTGVMCEHTGCTARTPARTHGCYAELARKTQILSKKYIKTSPIITVNLTACHLNTPQPLPKLPPSCMHACTRGAGLHPNRAARKSDVDSVFDSNKQPTVSPTCQTFTTGWEHTGHQNPPTTAPCVQAHSASHMPVRAHARYSKIIAKTLKIQKLLNFSFIKAVNSTACPPKVPQPLSKTTPPCVHARTHHTGLCAKRTVHFTIFLSPSTPAIQLSVILTDNLQNFIKYYPKQGHTPTTSSINYRSSVGLKKNFQNPTPPPPPKRHPCRTTR